MTSLKLTLLILCTTVSFAEESRSPSMEKPSARVERAVSGGLAFLASHQNQNGSWSAGAYSQHVGITGLCVMALLAGGNLPNEGNYATNVARGLDYIVKMTQRDGYITSEGSRMYGHGFAALSLAEAYGVSPGHPEVGEKLRDAVGLIVRTQKPDGGWRYTPSRAGVSDLSVTVCQIQALRAARNAGIKVPKETVERATKYITACANPDGSFRYMPQQVGHSIAMSGAAVTALYGTGDYHSKVLMNGVEFLRRYARHDFHKTNYYHYAHYYCAQAMFQAGGANWKLWYPKVREDLLSKQRRDGSWKGDEVGPVYGSAMATIVLQIPNQFLPIFQR